MENVEELKPCPFCGSTKLKLMKKNYNHKGYTKQKLYVRCNKCNARGGTVSQETIYTDTVDEDIKCVAIDLWNNRK